MNESYGEFQSIDRDSAIALSKTLKDHMSVMVHRALDAMMAITIAQDDTDRFVDAFKGQKKEKEDTVSTTSSEPKACTADSLDCDLEIWKKHLNHFLTADESEMLSAGTTSIQFFLSIGIRFYFERLKDKHFFIMTDLGEMLSVDRKIHELIGACWTIASGMPDSRKEYKRQYNSRVGKKSAPGGPNDTWESIKRELQGLDPKLKWSISGIADKIHNKVGKTKNTVIKLFKQKLGRDITGKAYRISEVITMCEKE